MELLSIIGISVLGTPVLGIIVGTLRAHLGHGVVPENVQGKPGELKNK